MTTATSGTFEGRTAIVTGAGGVLGREVAARLAAAGAHVLLVDRDPAALEKTLASLGTTAGRVATHVADVSVDADVASYVDAARALGTGEIALFFNNAGIEGVAAPIEDQRIEDFDRVMAANVRGVFLGMSHVLRYMTRGAVIVNTCSTAGHRGAANLAPYIASKHAVLGLTRTVSLENQERGIRICAVSPGPIEGRMMASLNTQRGLTRPDDSVEATAIRYSDPAEVAAAVMFLFSDEASFITGSALVVDGGRLS